MDDINGYRYVLYVLRALFAFVKLCCACAVLFAKEENLKSVTLAFKHDWKTIHLRSLRVVFESKMRV